MNTIMCRQAVLGTLAGFLLITFQTTDGNADDLPTLVGDAFEAMAATPTDQWAYRLTTVEGDERKVERFDPSLATSPWILQEVNGRPPAGADLKAYEKEIEARDEPNLPDDFVFTDFVDVTSLTLRDEDETRARYAFTPLIQDEDDEKFVPYLTGTLTINKVPLYVAAIELANNAAFSPEIGAKVLKMHIQATFEPLGEGGPFFLSTVTENIEGRAFGFMKVADNTVVSVGDYVYVGN